MNKNPDISDQIFDECVSNWRNMHLGLFYAQIPQLLEEEILNGLVENFNFPKIADGYELDKINIHDQIHSHKTEKRGINSFSYFIIWNFLGNIFRAFKEGLNKEQEFVQFMEQKLNGQYNDLSETISFFRNFFSHNIDEQFRIHSEDIRARKYTDLIINLHLDSEELQLQGPKIETEISLDFSTIKSGDKLIDCVGFDKIFIFSDICARLALDFKHSRINEYLRSFER